MYSNMEIAVTFDKAMGNPWYDFTKSQSYVLSKGKQHPDG